MHDFLTLLPWWHLALASREVSLHAPRTDGCKLRIVGPRPAARSDYSQGQAQGSWGTLAVGAWPTVDDVRTPTYPPPYTQHGWPGSKHRLEQFTP